MRLLCHPWVSLKVLKREPFLLQWALPVITLLSSASSVAAAASCVPQKSHFLRSRLKLHSTSSDVFGSKKWRHGILRQLSQNLFNSYPAETPTPSLLGADKKAAARNVWGRLKSGQVSGLFDTGGMPFRALMSAITGCKPDSSGC